MRMALVKLALATGVGLVTLAACGSANDGYDASVADDGRVRGGSGQSAMSATCSPRLLTIKTTNFVGDPVGGVTVEWYRREWRRHRQHGHDHDRRERPRAGELGPGPDRRAAEGAGGRALSGRRSPSRRRRAAGDGGWRRRRRRARCASSGECTPSVARCSWLASLRERPAAEMTAGARSCPRRQARVSPPQAVRARRAIAGTTLPVPYTVHVTDEPTHPVAGVTVRWTPVTAAGTSPPAPASPMPPATRRSSTRSAPAPGSPDGLRLARRIRRSTPVVFSATALGAARGGARGRCCRSLPTTASTTPSCAMDSRSCGVEHRPHHLRRGQRHPRRQPERARRGVAHRAATGRRQPADRDRSTMHGGSTIRCAMKSAMCSWGRKGPASSATRRGATSTWWMCPTWRTRRWSRASGSRARARTTSGWTRRHRCSTPPTTMAAWSRSMCQGRCRAISPSRLIAQVRPGGPDSTYTWGVQLANGSIYASDM